MDTVPTTIYTASNTGVEILSNLHWVKKVYTFCLAKNKVPSKVLKRKSKRGNKGDVVSVKHSCLWLRDHKLMRNNRHYFTTFELTYPKWQENRHIRGLGIGFVLLQYQKLVCIDFDFPKNKQGKIITTPEAIKARDELICQFKDCAYIEHSKSGHGIHIITHGAWNDINDKGKKKVRYRFQGYVVEIWTEKRLIQLTGHIVENYSEAANGQEKLNALLTQIKDHPSPLAAAAVADISENKVSNTRTTEKPPDFEDSPQTVKDTDLGQSETQTPIGNRTPINAQLDKALWQILNSTKGATTLHHIQLIKSIPTGARSEPYLGICCSICFWVLHLNHKHQYGLVNMDIKVFVKNFMFTYCPLPGFNDERFDAVWNKVSTSVEYNPYWHQTQEADTNNNNTMYLKHDDTKKTLQGNILYAIGLLHAGQLPERFVRHYHGYMLNVYTIAKWCYQNYSNLTEAALVEQLAVVAPALSHKSLKTISRDILKGLGYTSRRLGPRGNRAEVFVAPNAGFNVHTDLKPTEQFMQLLDE